MQAWKIKKVTASKWESHLTIEKWESQDMGPALQSILLAFNTKLPNTATNN